MGGLRRHIRLALLVTFGLVLGPYLTTQSFAAGADVDADFRDPNEAGAGYQIVVLKDQSPVGGFSYMMNGGLSKLCSSLNDQNCQGDKSQINYRALLQPCQSTTELDCISGFGSASESNDLTPASFLGNFPTSGRHDFSGDQSLKLPRGGPATLWSVPSLPHGGGSTYMVQVQTSGSYRGSEFAMSEFGVEIYPIELIPDVCIPRQGADDSCETNQGPGFYDVPITEVEYDKDGNELPRETRRGQASRVSSSSFDCIVLAQDQCARRHAFPQDARLYLKIKLSQSPKGWQIGRAHV